MNSIANRVGSCDTLNEVLGKEIFVLMQKSRYKVFN